MGTASDKSESNLNGILRKFLDGLKTSEMKKAKSEVTDIVKEIITRIETKDSRFKMGLAYRGSVYEKLKINEADEFDFDLPIIQLTIDEAPKKRDRDVPSEYTFYTLRPALQEAWKSLADPDGKLLSAERVVQAFSNLARQAINDMNKEEKIGFDLDFKTNHPAVTIICKKDGEKVYDIDLAPVIEVKKWPETLTLGWEKRTKKGWPSEELIKKIKETSSVYLVPKLYKERHHTKRDYLWRYAFNTAEKKLLLDSDPSVDNNCRRPVLRILKGLLHYMNWPGLRSYHMKTILLHEYETWGESDKWKPSELGARVRSATTRLSQCLSSQKPKLKHYFLSDINILEGINEEQRKQILESLKAFSNSPETAVANLLAAQATSNEKKQVMDACKPYVSLLQDFMDRVKAVAQEQNNEQILEVCREFEVGPMLAIGMKNSCKL